MADPPAMHPPSLLSCATATRKGATNWRYEAFGLTPFYVVRGPGGEVRHAELAWGTGLVMLGPYGGPEWLPTGPACVYLAVEDADAHHDQAVATGAEVVMELTDQDYGSREYAARDLEGHVWCFGTFRPGAGQVEENSEP